MSTALILALVVCLRHNTWNLCDACLHAASSNQGHQARRLTTPSRQHSGWGGHPATDREMSRLGLVAERGPYPTCLGLAGFNTRRSVGSSSRSPIEWAAWEIDVRAVTHAPLCVIVCIDERDLANALAESDPIAQWRWAGGGERDAGMRVAGSAGHVPAPCAQRARPSQTQQTPCPSAPHTRARDGSGSRSRLPPHAHSSPRSTPGSYPHGMAKAYP